MKVKNEPMKIKVIPVAGITALVATITLFSIIYSHEGDRIEARAKEAIHSSSFLFERHIQKTQERLASSISLIQKNNPTRNAFQARNREELLRAAEPYFSHLKRFNGFSHLYFTLPGRENFLRVHFPERNGDIIDRPSQLAAEHTGELSYGIDKGVFGTLTLRSVSPWREQGNLLGYVELGVEIQEIARQLQPSDLIETLIFVDKDAIDVKSLREAQGRFLSNPVPDRFSSLILTSPSALVLPSNFDLIVKEASTTSGKNMVEMDFGGKYFYLSAHPIQGTRNTVVGYVTHLVDVTLERKEQIQSTTVFGLISIAVLGMVLAAFWIYLGLTENSRRQFQHSLLMANIFRLASSKHSLEWLDDEQSSELEIIHKSPEGIAIFTPDDRLALFNDACKKLFPLIANRITNGMAFRDYIYLAVNMGQFDLGGADPNEIVQERMKQHRLPGSAFEKRLSDGRYLRIIERKTREGGTIVAYQDITKEKDMELNLVRLSRAIEQSPVSVIITDIRGTIEYVNKRFVSSTGYSAAEAIGQNPRILNSRTASSDTYRELWKTILSGQRWRGELQNKRKDGSLYYVLARIFPVTDSNGKITNFIGMQEDITEQKKSEDALRESEALLSLHMERTPLAAITWDANFRVILWNQAAEGIFGYTREEALGKHACELIIPSNIQEYVVNDIFHALLCKSGGESSTNENITKDGKHITCEWYNTPLVDGAGDVVRVTSLAHDVTRRKHAEEQLIHAKQLAEAANEAKGMFLANIGHELRTPIHGIMSYARLGADMVDTGDTDAILRCLTRIEASSDRLSGLVNDILTLNKMSSDFEQTQIKLQVVNLRELIQKIIDEFQSLADDKQIQIIMSQPDIDTNAPIDEIKMYQAFGNLLSNAIKFSPQQGVITITFSNTQLNTVAVNTHHGLVDAITVSVADRGIGIPEHELEDIFDRFSQSSRTDTGAGGTGLGLAICREAVKLHNGTVWAENNSHDGAVFHVSLPKTISDISNG